MNIIPKVIPIRTEEVRNSVIAEGKSDNHDVSVATHYLEKKGEKVPLVLVKAVGTRAEQKGDNLAAILPLITRFYAYLNKSSVQEWLIDVNTPEDKKTLKMTIRSDSGVRAGKKVSLLGRLGKFTMLKLQYSGIS